MAVWWVAMLYLGLQSVGPGSGVPFHTHSPTFAETVYGRKVGSGGHVAQMLCSCTTLGLAEECPLVLLVSESLCSSVVCHIYP